MAIYAIGDLHLSFGENKPMDIFGDNWINHEMKIKENWETTVRDNDLVVIPGDFSWGMNLNNTVPDFEYINKLPGKKVLLKGNHDYWWTTVTKLKNLINENNFQNIDFIYNTAICYNNKIIAGTRGWSELEDNAEKVIRRENIRLENSIIDGIKKYGDDKEIIVFMHYPPFNSYEEKSMNFIKTMKKYNVKRCFYGHIHGAEAHKEAKQGIIEGIDFKLVSADYLGFNLEKITD